MIMFMIFTIEGSPFPQFLVELDTDETWNPFIYMCSGINKILLLCIEFWQFSVNIVYTWGPAHHMYLHAQGDEIGLWHQMYFVLTNTK